MPEKEKKDESLHLIISEQAIMDLEDIWIHIAQDSIPAADKFIDILYEKCGLDQG